VFGLEHAAWCHRTVVDYLKSLPPSVDPAATNAARQAYTELACRLEAAQAERAGVEEPDPTAVAEARDVVVRAARVERLVHMIEALETRIASLHTRLNAEPVQPVHPDAIESAQRVLDSAVAFETYAKALRRTAHDMHLAQSDLDQVRANVPNDPGPPPTPKRSFS
jgi:hypothetical protein